MKILHAPENIGGMAGVLASTQRKLGHEAYSYSFISNHFKFSSDYILNDPSSWYEKLTRALSYGYKFDVFHFYFGSSLLGNTLKDVKWLSRLGKKVFFYFCGCDIRDEKLTIMQYPISACANCFPKLCNPYRQLSKEVAEKYGRVNFVSTPDLLQFVDNSVLLPQVVDFDLIDRLVNEEIPERDPNKLVIAHAPTNRLIKGTQYVLDTVEQLQKKGLEIELLLIENLNHEEALRKYRSCDLAIDQLLVGSYGLLAAELMALEIPTIAYIRDDLKTLYPLEPPIINANPNTLEKVLIDLYWNRDQLTSIKSLGRKYAYTVHHPIPISIKCLEYYES
jgi:hypothetical protein